MPVRLLLLLSTLSAFAAAPPFTEAPRPADRQRSLERQQSSVEKQMQSILTNYPSFWPAQNAITAPRPDCPPLDPKAAKTIIDREAARQGVNASLVQAVVEAESAYMPCAVSPVGAMGLMQLMPATASQLSVTNPYDPDQNISAGTQYLKQMLDRYGGDMAKALAAYNAGPARVDAEGGVPPITETQDYVRKVMGKIAPPQPVPKSAIE